MADNQIKLPETSKLIVSSSPHFHKKHDSRKVMLTVIAALLPACAVGIAIFGWRAVWVLGISTLACVLCEVLFCKLRGRPIPLADGSAVVTGLLLGMNLSAATPWWVCVIGAILAIGLAKQLYGGLGYNIFNPVLVARVGLLIALPGTMTTWVSATPGEFLPGSVNALTTATPLSKIAEAGFVPQTSDYWNYFIGNMPGCLGETSVLALLLGGALLAFKGYIRWQIPAAYIGTVAAITFIANTAAPATYAPVQFHLLTGGLFLGAIFMATDMVTSPMSKKGAIIFGIGCGVITAVIRLWGNLPEGVSFSILFMNALVPLIDRYTANKPFGLKKAGVKT
ncbi:MAG: RnfABCDGE type electron transport complex subunit D [Lentisphaeria bacterium]